MFVQSSLMRRLVLSLAGVFTITVTFVLAQRTVTFQRLDVTDTAVGLATTTTDPAGRAPITQCQGRVETAQIRLLDLRAVAVSATTGRVLEVGDVIDLDTHDAAENVRFMKTGSTSAVVQIECWS